MLEVPFGPMTIGCTNATLWSWMLRSQLEIISINCCNNFVFDNTIWTPSWFLALKQCIDVFWLWNNTCGQSWLLRTHCQSQNFGTKAWLLLFFFLSLRFLFSPPPLLPPSSPSSLFFWDPDYLWIYLAGMGVKGFGAHAKSSNVKVILNGGQRVTFLRHDGSFSLYPIFPHLDIIFIVIIVGPTVFSVQIICILFFWEECWWIIL